MGAYRDYSSSKRMAPVPSAPSGATQTKRVAPVPGRAPVRFGSRSGVAGGNCQFEQFEQVIVVPSSVQVEQPMWRQVRQSAGLACRRPAWESIQRTAKRGTARTVRRRQARDIS
jgi:hypothetical protein